MDFEFRPHAVPHVIENHSYPFSPGEFSGTKSLSPVTTTMVRTR